MKFEIPVLCYTGYILLQLLLCVSGQHEVCRMYGMDTSCRYRIDGISLSWIRVVINQCSHPVEVTFTITNQSPRVNFQHTFNSADTLVSVPGFIFITKLRVRLTEKDDDVINVEADFDVYKKGQTDFLNDDIKLWGADEQCPGLNTAAKISVGVMGTLAVIAGILVVILIYIKYQRTHKDNNAENQSTVNTENQSTVNTAVSGSSRPHQSSTLVVREDVDHRSEGHGFGERREERYNQARQQMSGNRYSVESNNFSD